MKRLAFLFGLGLVAGGCKHKIQPADCTRMLDHYIDMVIAGDPSLNNLSPAQAADVRAMKKAVKKAEPSYARVEGQCETEVTSPEYDCAMSAKTPDEWEACIE